MSVVQAPLRCVVTFVGNTCALSKAGHTVLGIGLGSHVNDWSSLKLRCVDKSLFQRTLNVNYKLMHSDLKFVNPNSIHAAAQCVAYRISNRRFWYASNVEKKKKKWRRILYTRLPKKQTNLRPYKKNK